MERHHAGTYLKDLRERLGLGVREVQQASALIAAEEGNQDYYISAARLSQIENGDSAPSVFKLISVSVIYGIDFGDLLDRYGANPDRVQRYRELVKPNATHLVSLEGYSPNTQVSMPFRLDPAFRWDTTQLLNRVVAQWGKIPAVLLQDLNPRRQLFGYIGMSDWTMYPLLRPGALVMIDPECRRVTQTGWLNEAERPIYFMELRDGYRCAWCQVEGLHLILLPHPMSPEKAQSFRFPDEIEIVGRVIGVAMRLQDMAPP